jgi:hypothetical protein
MLGTCFSSHRLVAKVTVTCRLSVTAAFRPMFVEADMPALERAIQRKQMGCYGWEAQAARLLRPVRQQKSPLMLPIPGTANISHLEENMAAKIQFSPEEWKKIEAAG